MKREIIEKKISDLTKDEIFSFRTIRSPIWWKAISIENGILKYTGLRHAEFVFESSHIDSICLVKKLF
jgi:hypothetical protein